MHYMEHREIPLRARDGSVRAMVLVDADDYDWLNASRWSLIRGYAYRGKRRGDEGRGTVLMHRQIMGLETGDPREVDHVNGDGLDNRRSNLRVVDKREQQQNLRSHGDSRSKYRGVSLHKRTGTWVVQVQIDRKRHCLGYYADEDEAGRVAADFRRQHMTHAVDR